MNGCMNIKEGYNEYSDKTFACDQFGCVYCTNNGRCIYNIATLQQEVARACHHDIVQADREMELDFL